MSNVEWDLDLRRRLGNEEVAEWDDLQEALSLVNLSEADDVVIWALEAKGTFTTKSLYRMMKNGGVGVSDHRLVDF